MPHAPPLRGPRIRSSPYVTDQDAAAIKNLVARLQAARPQDEDACRTMLEHELRKHAYLL